MNIAQLISNKLSRKLLNLSLSIIKKHIEKQPDLYIYIYHRKIDSLIPLTWKARGITAPEQDGQHQTNNWGDIKRVSDYSNKVVVDIGASLGATAVPFSRDAKIVYAFEPQQDNYNHLLDQINIRGIDNIKPFQIAVSDFNGTAEFFNRESHGIHSLGVHNKGEILSSSEVNVTKLDVFWRREINEQIGLLKIDVEGFETEVLRGATYLLANKLIDSIIFEFSPRIHKLRDIDIDSPLKILRDNGYEIFTVTGELFELSDKTPKICDLMALPKQKTN